jgi:hypothetical protein
LWLPILILLSPLNKPTGGIFGDIPTTFGEVKAWFNVIHGFVLFDWNADTKECAFPRAVTTETLLAAHLDNSEFGTDWLTGMGWYEG